MGSFVTTQVAHPISTAVFLVLISERIKLDSFIRIMSFFRIDEGDSLYFCCLMIHSTQHVASVNWNLARAKNHHTFFNPMAIPLNSSL